MPTIFELQAEDVWRNLHKMHPGFKFGSCEILKPGIGRTSTQFVVYIKIGTSTNDTQFVLIHEITTTCMHVHKLSSAKCTQANFFDKFSLDKFPC